jgi:nitroreductase
LDTVDAILARRSVRAYEPMPVADEDLARILEAVRQAPSARNYQPVHFILVRDPELKRRLASACNEQHWMAQADIIVAALAWPDVSPKWHVVDTAIALHTLVLVATSLGYGTCWVGSFVEREVKALLGIPDDARVVALTPLGRRAERPDARERKPLSALFSQDRFGEPIALTDN